MDNEQVFWRMVFSLRVFYHSTIYVIYGIYSHKITIFTYQNLRLLVTLLKTDFEATIKATTENLKNQPYSFL